MSNQKQAVIQAVQDTLGSNFVIGSTDVRSMISDGKLSIVRNIVVAGVVDGTVEYGKDRADVGEVRRYVNGMVSNYFRKAKELNGGIVYAPAASRGQRKPNIQAMIELRDQYSLGSDEYEAINSAIEIRTAKEKNNVNSNKKTNLDVDSLTPELRDLFVNE